MPPTRPHSAGLSPPVTPGDESPAKMREMQDRMRALELRAQGIRDDWQQGESRGFIGQMPSTMSSPSVGTRDFADVTTPQQAWGPEALSMASPPMGSPSSAYPELVSAVGSLPTEDDPRGITPEVARFRRTHEARLRHFREERTRDLSARIPATMLAAHVDGGDDYDEEEVLDAHGAAISPRQRRARAMKHVLQSSDVHAWQDFEGGGKALYDWSEQRVRTVGNRGDPSPVTLTKEDWKEFDKPPRPFVPGGARARPIHAAMDEHYYRVTEKSPRSPKARARSRSTTPAFARNVSPGGARARSVTPPRAMDAAGRRQIDSRGNLVHEKGAGWRDPRFKHRNPQNRSPTKRRQQFMDNRKAAELEAQKKWEKARAAETAAPTQDRNRPFVPAGAQSRPVHQALDVHCSRKATPFPEPKPHTEVAVAHRPVVSSHRISPSRPNDPHFMNSPFRHLLEEMKAPRRQAAPLSRRPFVPGGAQQRPVHKHMEEHVKKVQRNIPRPDKRVRQANPSGNSPFSPPQSPGRDPVSPISPRSEMETPGYNYERSLDESYGGRYLTSGVSARGDKRLRAEDKKRRERDQRIIEDLSRTIEYPGDVRPVQSMLDQSFATSVDSPHSFGGR